MFLQYLNRLWHEKVTTSNLSINKNSICEITNTFSFCVV